MYENFIVNPITMYNFYVLMKIFKRKFFQKKLKYLNKFKNEKLCLQNYTGKKKNMFFLDDMRHDNLMNLLKSIV